MKKGVFILEMGKYFWRTPLRFGNDSAMNSFIVEALGKH